MMYKFVCVKCGSVGSLLYEKWVHCEEKVIVQDCGQVEYGMAAIDEDNELSAVSGYKCGSCGKSLSLYGGLVSNESDLRFYMSMSSEDIIAMEELCYRAEDAHGECYEPEVWCCEC